jgi:hypothetical protein
MHGIHHLVLLFSLRQLISHAAPDARLPLLQRRNYKWAKWHHLTVGAAAAAAAALNSAFLSKLS